MQVTGARMKSPDDPEAGIYEAIMPEGGQGGWNLDQTDSDSSDDTDREDCPSILGTRPTDDRKAIHDNAVVASGTRISYTGVQGKTPYHPKFQRK
jgi:hypothetical protein